MLRTIGLQPSSKAALLGRLMVLVLPAAAPLLVRRIVEAEVVAALKACPPICASPVVLTSPQGKGFLADGVPVGGLEPH